MCLTKHLSVDHASSYHSYVPPFIIERFHSSVIHRMGVPDHEPAD